MIVMSYKHKDIFIESLSNFIYPGKIFDEALSELDHVYAQAAKVDEYEKSKHRTHVNDCKAEAFDAILKAYDEAFSREHMAGEVSNIIEKYESGGLDG